MDGNDIEFVYTRTTKQETVLAPDYTDKDKWSGYSNGHMWTDHPQGISAEYPYEWASQRLKENGKWGNYCTPFIWAHWGQVGTDGDGIQYVYKLTTAEIPPQKPSSLTTSNTYIKDEGEVIPVGWTDNPTGISETYPCEWVMVRKVNDNTTYTSQFSTPALWAKYGFDGKAAPYTVFAQLSNDSIH